jgi:hypothetical protein
MRPFRFSLTFSILASLAASWALPGFLSLISFKTAEQDCRPENEEVLLATFTAILPKTDSLNEQDAAGRFIAKLARERDCQPARDGQSRENGTPSDEREDARLREA